MVDLGDTFHDLVWPSVVKRSLGLLLAAIPIPLPAPIVWMITQAFYFGAEKLYVVLKDVFDLEKIAFKKAEDLGTYKKTQVTLQVIAHNKGIESQEFINARAAALDVFDRMVAVTL